MMQMPLFMQLGVVIFFILVIVIVLSRLSIGHTLYKVTHYRCTHTFKHAFPKFDIDYMYNQNKKEIPNNLNCPKAGCPGELVLYAVLSNEEYERRLEQSSDKSWYN